MKKRGFKRFSLSVAGVLLFGGCAQMVVPTGGDRDTKPPAVVRVYPKNKTTHFTAPQVLIQFDEFFVLNNPGEQVVISPPLAEKPTFEIEGKKLRVRLPEGSLKPNSTYTINFGNAIGDLHENNILSDFTYVFSTGAHLDSLMLTGACKQAFNNQVEKDVTIGLYDAATYRDSTPFLQVPLYFGKTRSDGQFLIENIPAGPFRVFAFKDENKNLKYDQTEVLAYLPDTIYAADSARRLTLFSYSPDPYATGRLLDTLVPQKGKFVLTVFKPLPDAVKPLQQGYGWRTRNAANLDTFTYFFPLKDSLPAFDIHSRDMAYRITLRTKPESRLPAFSASIQKQIETGDSIRIFFSVPVATADTSLIRFIADTVRVKPLYTAFSADRRSYLIWYPQQEATAYKIILNDSAFKDIYGQYAMGQQHSWLSKTQKDYCSLKLDLVYKGSTPVLMQLWDEKETQVYREFYISSDQQLQLTNMIPGTYRVKFILDINDNKTWDNGNYLRNEQPERVFYLSESIQLRANWDLEQRVDIHTVTTP